MTTKTTPERREETQMLVKMLQQAARLEHSLLNCYLYTAASIKSMPQEFEFLSNGKINKRRAIHFEKARHWKKSILEVSHEEMRHLHYVQCLLRALGESPDFTLPERDQTGSWIIPNWDIHTYSNQPSSTGAQIPLDNLTIEQMKRFILFESTDSLQDTDPFGERITNLFNKLNEFELDFHLESALYMIEDPDHRVSLKKKLKHIYLTVSPSDKKELDMALQAALPEDDLKYVRFQSIGDLYMRGILPLYQQAFHNKEVRYSNFTFNNELQGFQAEEGLLPIGPIYRSKNFSESAKSNEVNPLRYFKNVKSIIEEIVEEGEGFSGFEKMAETFLARIDEIGGTRAYLEVWNTDKKSKNDPTYQTPQWLAEAELCRQSHLYKFAIIYMDMKFEKDLSRKAGVEFHAHRVPVRVDKNNHAIRKMVEEMPGQFNACYLVMLAWLSRIYEIKLWQTDKDRRGAIEMLATWPLMSLAIRPFLELMSFFDIDKTRLFRLDKGGMPVLPTEALQLVNYFNSDKRSEETNIKMDYLATRILSNAAQWASEQIEILEGHITGNDKEMILARLTGLSRLNEFEKQFPFRVHGGYSNQLPDKNYQIINEKDRYKYAEDPSNIKNLADDPATNMIFQDTLVLKLRFGGFGLIQLSTDPDPPTDESGCSGTHMLHASDGDKRFDRSLVWQDIPGEKNIIRRDPVDKLPPLGINLIDASLHITESTGAKTGYAPLQVMKSTGAVQASGVQQYLHIEGLNELASYQAEEINGGNPIRFNLLSKDGARPLLYGDNHLVSKDGEPIDPFILSITDSDFNTIFQREIYNEGRHMREMNPLQRVYSARWPTGFDTKLGDIPSWIQKKLPKNYINNILGGPATYLNARANILYKELENLLAIAPPIPRRDAIDQIVSLVERLNKIVLPRRTTYDWLKVLLHYGHSISGDTWSNEENNILYDFIEQKLNIRISGEPAEANRNNANSRWLIKYTKGIMDTDMIGNLLYGELYIPLQICLSDNPFRISKSWRFAKDMSDILAHFACRFDKPFWARFEIDGDTRATLLGPEFDNIKIVETLLSSEPWGYTYSADGVSGISGYKGQYRIIKNDDHVELRLALEYSYKDQKAFNLMTMIVGDYFKAVTTALQERFLPQ